MSSIETLVSSVSGLGFAVGFAVAMFSLEHMRQQVNGMLPPDQCIGYGFPRRIGRSFGEAVYKWNILHMSLEVVDKHRKYHPASSLRKKFAFGLLGVMLFFFGLGLSIFL